jgi:hypothetical protein
LVHIWLSLLISQEDSIECRNQKHAGTKGYIFMRTSVKFFFTINHQKIRVYLVIGLTSIIINKNEVTGNLLAVHYLSENSQTNITL